MENVYIVDEKVFQLETMGEGGKDNIVMLQLSLRYKLSWIKLTDP